jgi:hypothetical protein
MVVLKISGRAGTSLNVSRMTLPFVLITTGCDVPAVDVALALGRTNWM